MNNEMEKQNYVLYNDNTKRMIGLARGVEMADEVINMGKELGVDVAAQPISSKKYVELRAKQDRRLTEKLGRLSQEILSRSN